MEGFLKDFEVQHSICRFPVVRVSFCKCLALRVDLVFGTGLFLVRESGSVNMSSHSIEFACNAAIYMSSVHCLSSIACPSSSCRQGDGGQEENQTPTY